MFGLLVLAPGPTPGSAGEPPNLSVPGPDEVMAAVNRERALQGLSPVAFSDRLGRAAQAHVDDMVRLGYFAVVGPVGAATVEQLVTREGYGFTLVTEKLVRTPLEQSIPALALGWRGSPATNRSSLFHPQVREIGVGVAASGAMRTMAIVLATADGPAAVAAGSAEAFAALAREPAAATTALFEAVNSQRAARQLPALRADSVLALAAKQHADALLAALVGGRPTSEVGSLADLVSAQRPGSGSAGPIIAGEVSRQRRPSNRGSGVGSSIGQVIVTDATSAAMALETALRATAASDLRENRFRSAGVGLAVQPPGTATPVGRAVWVIALSVH